MKKCNNNENPEQLIKQLFGPDQVKKVTEDIRSGFKFFDLHPAPEPDKTVLNAVKAQVAKSVIHKHKVKIFKNGIYKAAAIAAVLVFAAIVSNQVITKQNKTTGSNGIALIPAAVWNNSEIISADDELAMLSAEIEQIEREFTNLENPDRYEGYSELSDLEMEFIEVESEFWKG